VTLSADDLVIIRREIMAVANVILAGKTKSTAIDNKVGTEAVEALISGATEARLPVVHPYGFTSRSTKGTVAVTGRQGDHPASRVVLGHRDDNRPELSAEGEVAIYDNFGHKIWLKDGEIDIAAEKMKIGGASDKMALAQKTFNEINALYTQHATLVALLAATLAPMSTYFTSAGPVVVATPLPNPFVAPTPVGPNQVNSTIVESD